MVKVQGQGLVARIRDKDQGQGKGSKPKAWGGKEKLLLFKHGEDLIKVLLNMYYKFWVRNIGLV